MTEAATSVSLAPFELKGSLFTLTVMHLRSPDVESIVRELDSKTSQAPEFFKNTPVVLDLADLASDAGPDFGAIDRQLRNFGLVPVGARNGAEAVRDAAVRAGWALFPSRVDRPKADEPEEEAAPEPSPDVSEPPADQPDVAPATGSSTRVVSQPVRSGQQIYAAGGDLLVLRTVSAGAEIIADGNIHVLGALRGRALAGLSNDEDTHIICQSLEAELISIAGRYRVFEELDPAVRGKAVHIHLSGDRLLIEPI
jgi:septum site-determining protein MinC